VFGINIGTIAKRDCLTYFIFYVKIANFLTIISNTFIKKNKRYWRWNLYSGAWNHNEDARSNATILFFTWKC